MGSRRMLSKKITESGRFLRLKPELQMLYMHLIMNADDDGVVEGFTIMRSTGCTEEDLELLQEKNYITILNEDLVTFINDWREHNQIQPSKKSDSMYQDLVREKIPDVEFAESKKNQKEPEEAKNEDFSEGQNSGGETAENRRQKVGLSKESVSKDKLIQENIINSKESYTEKTDEQKKPTQFLSYKDIIDLYHASCPSLPKVEALTRERKKLIKAIITKHSIEKIEQVFKKAQSIPFLRGERNGKGYEDWTGANFDWILDENHFAKINEGHYDRRGQPMDSGMDYAAIEQQLMEN